MNKRMQSLMLTTLSGLTFAIPLVVQYLYPEVPEFVIIICKCVSMIGSFGFFTGLILMCLGVFEPVDDSRECAWGRSDQDKLFLYTMTPKRRLKKLRIKMCCESALVNLHIQLEPLCELVDVLEDKTSPFYQEYVNTYYSFTTYIEEIVDTLSAWNLQYKKAKSEEEAIILRKILNIERKNTLQPLVTHMVSEMDKIKKKEQQYQEDYAKAEKTLRMETPMRREDSFGELRSLADELNNDMLSTLIKKYDSQKDKKKEKRRKTHE